MKDVHLDAASVIFFYVDTINLMLKHRHQKSWNKNIKVQTQKIVILAGSRQIIRYRTG
jgi:hypothetical protein